MQSIYLSTEGAMYSLSVYGKSNDQRRKWVPAFKFPAAKEIIMISVEQRFYVLAKLAENIDWSKFTPAQLQVGLGDGKRAGQQMTEFIQNGFRVRIGEKLLVAEALEIEIPALPRPRLEELWTEYAVAAKSIERDTSPTEAVKFSLATVLRPDETIGINSSEYESRISSELGIILGYQQAKWLVEHQDEFPDFMNLLEKATINFSGVVIVLQDGDRVSPYLHAYSGRWHLSWSWIDFDFTPTTRVAVSK